MDRQKNRREFIRDVAICSSGIVISQWIPVVGPSSASEAVGAVEAAKMAICHGSSPSKITTAVIEAMGGMSKFVSKNDIVVIKPNIGWARTPEQGANTHPEIIASLSKMSLNSGAKEVRVLDNTCNEPRRCYKKSGIEEAAKAAGAKVMYFDDRKNSTMKIGGKVLKEWLVNRDIYEADCIINVPVAKHHGLSKLSLGMKNWIGAIGGRRNKLHQDIDQSIADLANFFKPKLVVLDGFRILTRNGPQGGSTKDVKYTHTVAAGTDQVAIDAYGSTLFGFKHDELEFVRIAAEMGIGSMDYMSLSPKEISV